MGKPIFAKRLLLGAALAAFITPPALAHAASGVPAPAETHAPANAASEALAGVLADYEAYLRHIDPISAGMEGDREALSRLPDPTRAGELARIAPLTALLNRVEAISPSALNADEQLNQSFVAYLIRRNLDAIPLDGGRLAFSSEGGPGQGVAYLASSTRITSTADAEAWLSRMSAIPSYYDAAIADARRGLDTGLVQARSVVDSALALAETDVKPREGGDILMQPFKVLPATIPAAEQAALRARAQALIDGPVAQRRIAWRDMLKNDYRPRAPVEPGMTHRPGGRELYANAVRSYTTTDLTPDQVHQIGLEEVARIRARMQDEMRAAGWTGDFAGFLNFLRTDPQFYATSREQLLEKASEIAKRADDGLPALFGTLPRLPYGVRPVPARSRTATPPAATIPVLCRTAWPAATSSIRPGWISGPFMSCPP